jgi:predicted GIY-YIG superfamily endonuclease
MVLNKEYVVYTMASSTGNLYIVNKAINREKQLKRWTHARQKSL